MRQADLWVSNFTSGGIAVKHYFRRLAPGRNGYEITIQIDLE